MLRVCHSLWVASVDEYDNAAAADRVPERLAALGPQHTMFYDNEIPSITEAATRTRLFAWELWRTHSLTNNLT